jgi:class 3 adenylate cyclase/tetratricopeptide (TPR) repeat protein
VARQERKVVTALFADLVGFTARASEMDPEDVAVLLSSYHSHLKAELERRGGTVEKFIGDAVMAVFGAPTAHEDDPERAVRAAIAIRDWAEEEGIELCIGVNTGEAFGGEPLAAGDVVNTAARLQAAALTGAILVGETTYRATRDVIDYRDQRPVEAKGKPDPVPVWEAAQARARVKVEREARAPLVGRRREVSLLRETLDRAHSEREPQLVTLVGVPGIGKSRLVYELYKTIEQRPDLVYWRHGRSLPYGDGVTFWALAEIVKAQAGILETDDSQQAEAKLHAAVAVAVPGEEDHDWLERHLRPLVGLEAEDAAPDRRTDAFAAWRRFFESLAEQRPLVLVFEDLHWADDALLDFVDHLIDWASGVPLLVLATSRPELLERRPGWGGGKANATTLSLSPLSDDETAELVHALLKSPVLSAGTQTELLARAGGNPLYAEEFTRLVVEGRPPDDLPESVQGLIAARVDTLSQEEKALLQAAAVVGKVFWLGSVAAVGIATRSTAEERLHALERKEFVRRERRSSVAGEDEYSFRHLLVRDVAYGQIPRAGRAEQHRLAADWIESLGRPEDHAEMLAHHYLSALELVRAMGRDDGGLVERALAAAVKAGDRALALNAFPAAARLYSHAVSLSDSGDVERPELLFRFGRALHYADNERAEQVLEEAARKLAAAERGEQAAEAHALLSQLWWDRGQRDRSFEELERARKLLGADESEARARVLARLARAQAIAGEHDGAIRAGGEALAIAERLGFVDVRADVLNSVGNARFQLGDAGGLADMERSLEIALAAGSHLAANAFNNLGFMHFLSGDVRRDRELREEALGLARRFGDERMLRFVRGSMPAHDFYAGHWQEALREADAFVAECEAGSSHYLESVVRSARALIRLAGGDAHGATEDALRAEELSRERKDPQIVLPALGVRLRLESELARLESVASLAAELLRQRAAHSNHPPALELAWIAERLQIADAVSEWLDRIVYGSAWTDAALAILDGELERAAELFVEIGSLPDEARARLRAAERLLADGRRAEADVQLDKALAFYRSVGATHYIREGEALLAISA